MPRPSLTLLLTLAFLTTAHAEKPRKPLPPLPAAQYDLHQTDQVARVTIAVEPGDIKETRPNTRLDYFGHDLLPLRIIVTNDAEVPLSLDDARILLILNDKGEGDSTTIQAATLEELQRRLVSLKSATGSKVPLPLPIPVPITTGKKNIDKKILDDDNDFSFTTTTIAPHTTIAGYLYYDIQGLDNAPSHPILAHATLELRKARFTNTSTYIDAFEIPLHPTSKIATDH